MEDSKYAHAEAESAQQDLPKRSSSINGGKPLPPLPVSPGNEASPVDSGKPSTPHSRTASRDQKPQNGSPIAPRSRRSTQKNSITDAAIPSPKGSRHGSIAANAPPSITTTAPPASVPEAAKAITQSREAAPTPEPPRPQSTAPTTKIPAKKITSKKGRPCVIRIPKDGLVYHTKEKPMALSEWTERLKNFEKEGYNVRGYDHEHLNEPTMPADVGVDVRGRSLFENPKDASTAGPSTQKPTIVIPDRRKWDAYRNELVEAKLKALGVIPADPEPEPEPEQEMDQMDMAMQDPSMFAALAGSPPPLSSSVNSQHQWQGPTPFSAPFSPAGFTNATSVGGVGSPVPSMGNPNMQRPGHLSRQSTFNFNFPGGFNPALQQQFSPQPGAGGPLGFHRGASPSLAGNAIPRMSSALSRNSPDPFTEQRSQTPRGPPAPFQSQAPPQLPMKNPRRTTMMNSAQSSGQVSANMTPQGSNQGFNNSNVISTPPNGKADEESFADLAYPTPRGHRSNISENLEREAEKPQYYPGEYVDYEEPAAAPTSNGIGFDFSGTNGLGKQAHSSKPSHTSTGSASKFNVAAKEFKFDPKAAAHNRKTSMAKNPFMPDQAIGGLGTKPTVSFVTAHANGETTGGNNFDARASNFKPPPQSDFSFGSVPFDFSKDVAPKPEPEKKEEEKDAKPKIFSGISIADFVKPAKKSKAIPIVNPNAIKKPSPQPEPEPAVDEDGRAAPEVGRHKRGRTIAPGADDIPRFATPSSTAATPQPPESVAESIKEKSQEPESKPPPTSQPATQEVKFAPVPVPSPKKPEPEQAAPKPAQPTKANPTEEKPDLQPSFKPVDITTETIKEEPKEDDDARWSDFGIDAPKTPPRTSKAKAEPLIDLHQNNESVDTTAPPKSIASVASNSTQNQRNVWKSFLDSSPPRIPSQDHLPRFPDPSLDPSFADIDKIMEQLNEQPNYGAEEEERRAPSPKKPASIVNERLGGPSPDLQESRLGVPDRLGPSPDQRESRPSGHGRRDASRRPSPAPAEWVAGQRSLRPSASPVRKLNSNKEAEVSDWDEVFSDREATKIQPQAQFFDTRVKSLIEGILQQHLSPLQKALKDVDSAIKSGGVGREPREAWPLTDKADKTESDADDEDNAEETDGQRGRSFRSEKKLDKIRSIVQEAVASQQSSETSTKRELDSLRSTLLEAISSSRPNTGAPAAGALDAQAIREAVKEVIGHKSVISYSPSTQFELEDVRAVIQEAVEARPMALSTPTPQIDLKDIRAIVQEVVDAKQDSTVRLQDEMRLRNDTERKANDLQRLLDLSEKELTLYKESSDNHERQMQNLRDDKSVAQQKIEALEKTERDLRGRTSGLSNEVSNLQGTLEEYRTSSTRWRSEIDNVKIAREKMHHNIEDLRQELQFTKQSRDNLGAKLEKMQEALAGSSSNLKKERENFQKERESFRARDEELAKENSVLSARLEEEFRTRQRLERELDRQGVHERNAIKATVSLEEVRHTNQRLMAEAAKLRDENANERNAAHLHKREAIEAKDIARAEIQRNKTLLEAEIDVANMRTENTRTDLETRLDHVRGELSAARHENAKVRQEHKQRIDESNVHRTQAVREASQSANAARLEERKHFERLTEQLSKQHDEAVRRVLDERQRAEVHFNETIKLSAEKVAFLEERARHLEDKVNVAQSAARAAAEAAQQQSTVKAKEAAAQREHLRPSERVSPQALRESIVVLQEQLQQRESRIESLESELDAVDKDLPNKVKDRDTEISWLRELLNVRLDDISELVNLLSLESYDRIAARDAAIRIRANLQMEQQEKERLIGRTTSSSSSRAAAANNPLPSLNDLQNFATPRAAQIAAAWGNWRKTGQSPSLASLRGVVSGQNAGAPGKPSSSFSEVGQGIVANNATAAQTFLSGLMTPPASNMRRTPTPQGRSTSQSRIRDDDEMSNVSDAQPLSLAAELGEDSDSTMPPSPSKNMTMSGARNGHPPRTPSPQPDAEEEPATPPTAVHNTATDLAAEMAGAEDDDDEEEEDADPAAEDDTGAEIAADSKLAPLET